MSPENHNQLSRAKISNEFTRLIAVVLAAAVGIGVTCSVFYPGAMSNDSLGCYGDAIIGVVKGNSQPAIISFLWKYILEVIPSPFGPLLFQNLIFWSGLALIAFECRLRTSYAVIAVFGIGFFPTVFALLGVLWKDILMAGTLTLFVGIVLVGVRHRSRAVLCLSLLPLAVAMAARLNAFPAIIPLAAWFIFSFLKLAGRKIPRPLTLAALSIVFSFCIYGAVQVANRAMITTGSSGAPVRMLQFSLIGDLAGIAVRTGDLRMPSRVWRLIPDITVDLVRNYYDVADGNPLMYNDRWDSDILVSTDPDEILELVRVWAGAITAHPSAYLHRRWDAVATILQIRGVFYPFHTGIAPNNLGLQFPHRPLYENLTHWLIEHQGWFFRGWVFAVIAIGVSALGIRWRRWSAAAVAASGVFYVVPYVVISTGADFRFVWWLVVATLLCVVLMLCETEPVIRK
jgi:hypothetical protein